MDEVKGARAEAAGRVAALEEHLGYWLRYVSNQVSLGFARRVEGRGVTVGEWVVLRELLDGVMAPSRVADRLGMTRGAITKLADRLIAKGLVRREADAHDGRAQTLELTAAGRGLVPVLAGLADENDAEFFGGLTAEERRELMQVLKGLVERHGWKSVPVG